MVRLLYEKGSSAGRVRLLYENARLLEWFVGCTKMLVILSAAKNPRISSLPLLLLVLCLYTKLL